MRLAFLVLWTVTTSVLAASKAPTPTASVDGKPRTLVRRAVTVSDAVGVVPLFVGGGVPTALTFPLELQRERVLLADVSGRFFEPQAMGRTLMLVPRTELGADERVVLQVLLSDGTLALFQLSRGVATLDVAVDVVLGTPVRAAPESLAALKGSVAELQARLDECEAAAAGQGRATVAALVLAQDPAKPEAFAVSKAPARNLDKQARLLVETKLVYRLFDTRYLVLLLENRDPTQPWVLERAEVSSGAEEARVVSVVSELKVLRPGEVSRVVVAFVGGASDEQVIRLFESGGSRNVELSF